MIAVNGSLFLGEGWRNEGKEKDELRGRYRLGVGKTTAKKLANCLGSYGIVLYKGDRRLIRDTTRGDERNFREDFEMEVLSLSLSLSLFSFLFPSLSTVPV